MGRNSQALAVKNKTSKRLGRPGRNPGLLLFGESVFWERPGDRNLQVAKNR
jgi:hypothetical protein